MLNIFPLEALLSAKTSDQQQRHSSIIIQMIFTLPGNTMTIHDPLQSNATTKHTRGEKARDKVPGTPESWSVVYTYSPAKQNSHSFKWHFVSTYGQYVVVV